MRPAFAPVVSELLQRLHQNPSVPLTGLPGGSKAPFLLALAAQSKAPLLVIAAEDVEADGLIADLEAWSTFLPSNNRPALLLFPELDPAARIASLGQWEQTPWAIVAASSAALSRPTFSAKELSALAFELRPGRPYPRAALLEKLAGGGYERVEMVEMEGEMAVRGEVLDIWPPGVPKPWRMLFDGDTLESLREFNAGTQRSEAYLQPQKLLPIKESGQGGVLADYAPKNTVWFWDELEPSPFSGEGGRRPGEGEILYRALPPAHAIDAGARSTTGLASGIKMAALEAKKHRDEGSSVLLFCHNTGECERLGELLEEQLGPRGAEGMEFITGPLRSGFVVDQLFVLTNSEIFGRYRHRPRLPKFKGGQVLHEARDLKTGEYVVHEHYGIGRYKGLELLTAGGQEAEFLKLEYSRGDRLYVPLADFRQVQKYSGAEGKSPRLNSLDTATWERVKARVKEGIQELAKDLLRIHAARAALPGHAFPPDSHLEEEFAASFIYEETPDQSRAIAEVKKDMESPRPMDRVVLGDVGYGKTEVAMRAAFKAVADSKQVAVLVPTTILAEQHYRTFVERFADYPVRIGMLSRFQTAKEEKETLAGAASGALDVVIGTHRLLQKDVAFHELGLLIIDEEHRFGVKHKEQLKKFRERLDVLTLTATPIPRTFSFALSGLRELSIIESPPSGRLPIATQIGPYDDAAVRGAVQKELERGGQVFYVHNRVQSMNTRLHFLQQLLPGVSIAVVHGQMSGPAIEKTMWEFIHRKHQILLATSIIESGIDIPTVNTLIVEEAEEFGLAQLYQLRGRVGRERQKAFCHLFYSGSTPLSADARARLEALREFTELGSGYRLAVRDMEIRGAGNLLGQEQSGFISAVGLDLYSQLLQDEIAKLRGEPVKEAPRFPSFDLAIHAFLPAEYLPSEELRIIFYKKLVSAESQEALDAVQQELEDRFGPLPQEAGSLMEVSKLRMRARDLGIAAVIQKPSSLDVQFLPNTPVPPETFVRLSQERAALRFRPGPPFTLQTQPVAFESAGPVAYLANLFKEL
ncbi:MAG: transcription-repair coupling factor [Elusimicrobia bacterium RIFCSPLOWO2_01_FULL_59_12]|nr:MAG: transcription-repair coupling factor [Elusimicrobia bacterium RIFCSPLOWO2_01_FULL_59_12]